MKPFKAIITASEKSIKAEELEAKIAKAKLFFNGKISSIEGKINEKQAELIDAEAEVDKVPLSGTYDGELDRAVSRKVKAIKKDITALEAEIAEYEEIKLARFGKED